MEARQLEPIKEEPRHSSLNQLLMKLTEADDELAEFDFTKEQDLIEQGRVKIDNYKFILDKLDALEAVYEKWIREYTVAKKSVAANRDRLAKHLVWTMQQNGFDKFAGHRYQVSVQRASPAVELKISEPNLQHKIMYPDYIRVKYEWDKAAIRDALKAGSEDAEKIAQLKDSFYAKFSVRKELEK